MLSYPVIENPDYPIKEELIDATIRSDMEGGYEITRPRYGRSRWKFTLKYSVLHQPDKITLSTFVATVKGAAVSFNWTHPTTGAVYAVRFKEPPVFELISYQLWATEVVLVTV